MDKIDRVIKIISESSAAQEASKERAAAQRERQREVLNKIRERQADRKEYLPKKPIKKLSKSLGKAVKKSEFSTLTKVSDEGKTGVTAVGQTAGNVVKAVGNIAKAGAKVARRGIKATKPIRKIVGNEIAMAKDKTKLRKGFGAKSKPMNDNQPKRSLTAKSVREEFIQEVENKKDKVDKVIDIMRGKNKIKINPEVKESVDKT